MNYVKLLLAATFTLFYTGAGYAHFGMIIPEQPIISQDNKTAEITLSFSHPFEGIGMELEKPARFGVFVDGTTTDLTGELQPSTVMEKAAWKTEYRFKRPGVYQFFMEPIPYWEPTEDVSIIHYTKTIIPAYGDDTEWDTPIGLPTEIVPLLRPFGNYAGNTFVGKVLLNGNPIPHAEVEVELYNQNNNLKAPSDYHITQVVKANEKGVFQFSVPQAGWWGFAALSEADYSLKNPEGKDKGVELGAVLWIYFHDLTGDAQ